MGRRRPRAARALRARGSGPGTARAPERRSSLRRPRERRPDGARHGARRRRLAGHADRRAPARLGRDAAVRRTGRRSAGPRAHPRRRAPRPHPGERARRARDGSRRRHRLRAGTAGPLVAQRPGLRRARRNARVLGARAGRRPRDRSGHRSLCARLHPLPDALGADALRGRGQAGDGPASRLRGGTVARRPCAGRAAGCGHARRPPARPRPGATGRHDRRGGGSRRRPGHPPRHSGRRRQRSW